MTADDDSATIRTAHCPDGTVVVEIICGCGHVTTLTAMPGQLRPVGMAIIGECDEADAVLAAAPIHRPPLGRA